MSKLQKVLLIILAVQLALVGVVFWPKQSKANTESALLGTLKAEDVVGLKITDMDGKQISFSKLDNAWMLSEADNFPAKSDKVEAALEKIFEINTSRLIAEKETSQKQLEVSADQYQRRIELILLDGSQKTLYIGSATGSNTVNVRLDGQNETYLTSALTASDFGTKTASWVDTSYVSVPSTQVKSIEIDNANGSFAFQKDLNSQWQMAGLMEDEILNSSQVDDLVGSAAVLNLVEPLGTQEKTEYGLDKPAAVVNFSSVNDSGEQSVHTLWIGKSDPSDQTYYAFSSDSKYYVKISSYTAEKYINTARESVVTATPTPTPES